MASNNPRRIQALWEIDEGSYTVGKKLQHAYHGTLVITQLNPNSTGIDILVKREKDGWEGTYLWIPNSYISGIVYELPPLEVKND